MPPQDGLSEQDTVETQFMDHFRELPISAQRVIIGIVLIVVIAALVILRDMIKSVDSDDQDQLGDQF